MLHLSSPGCGDEDAGTSESRQRTSFLAWDETSENSFLRLLDFETFGGFGRGVRRLLRQAADQLSNKLSHAQHLDEVTWTTKNWHGLQMQRLSVVLHTAVAWQTVNELACGDSGIVHGAKCIAVLNGVA